jgi:hypothetical protein
MMTPALVIDGEAKCAGKIPKKAELLNCWNNFFSYFPESNQISNYKSHFILFSIYLLLLIF